MGNPNGSMALCEVLTQEEIAKIALEIKRISDAGGWGKLELSFKKGRMARPLTTISPVYEDEGENTLLHNP